MCEYAASVGLVMDPWQEHVLDGALGEHGDLWAAFEVAVVVGRQNGKGGILEARELAAIELFDSKLVIHTAHELKTTEEAFRRMQILIESCPDLDRQVLRVNRTNGKEAIEFKNRARIKYAARSKQSGRGWDLADLLVFDEAMFLPMEAMAALIPTMTVAPNPQVWYTASAGLDESTQLKALRDRAQAGGDDSLAYFEWSAEEDADLDDPDAIAQANPALGIRITEGWIRKERAAFAHDQEAWARERLGIWGTRTRRRVIDADVWAALSGPPARNGKVAFAVDVPPEGGRAWIARAVEADDGTITVDVDGKPGTQWAIPRLCDLHRKRRAPVVLDPGSRAGSLLTGLVEGRAKPKTVTIRQITAACGRFVDLVEEGKLRHNSQVELNLAVDGAVKRPIGDSAWAWHRRDSEVDIGPLVAATYAVCGLQWAGKKTTGRAMAV